MSIDKTTPKQLAENLKQMAENLRQGTRLLSEASSVLERFEDGKRIILTKESLAVKRAIGHANLYIEEALYGLYALKVSLD